MDDPPSAAQFLAAVTGNPDLAASDLTTSLIWMVCLLGINALFVTLEYSLVAARRGRILQQARNGDPRALLVQASQDALDRALSTPQLGITVASLALGWIGAWKVAPVVGAGLLRLPFFESLFELLRPVFASPTDLAWSLAIPLTFILLTYLQIVLGELIPKTLAIVHAETVALTLAPFSQGLSRFLQPLADIPRMSSRLILRAFGVPIPNATALYNTITLEELEELLASKNPDPNLVIEEEERELLQNVFAFGDTIASEIMTPRTSIDAVPLQATLQDVLKEVASSGHSRYPVIAESLDEIKGVIFLKDLMRELGHGRLTLDSPIAPLMRPAVFVHENKLIAELLQDMQKHHTSIVMVADEFGGTAGLVTIENILEEIVGSIADIHDNGEDVIPDIEQISEDVFIVQAQLDVEEVNEQLDLDLPIQDDYQTLGGMIIYQMQRIPQEGDKHIWKNLEFHIVKAEGPRLDRIRITRLPIIATTTPSGSHLIAGEGEEARVDPEKPSPDKNTSPS
ncbi:MAG: hemolysin family protein [Thermostichales cyanobacterium DRC_bins_46]